MSKRRLTGCFKFGCFGCLSVVALGVGFVLLLGAIQVTSDQSPKPQQSQTSHELPQLADAVFPGADQGNIPDVELEEFPGDDPTPPPAGTLVLDLSAGEFNIRPGPPGEPIRVEADYDANSFELNEDFTANDDGTWGYKVRFGMRGGFLGSLFRGGANGSRNEVNIIIPRGHPVRIVGKIGMGESEIDLGGLWVEEVDLETSMGDHFVEFREPTPMPVQAFSLQGSMGEVEIQDLGNASPASVQVKHGMGEMRVDLEGEWRNDADININFSMGGCRLFLPDDVFVDVDRARVAMGEGYVERRDESQVPADAPTLSISAAGAMGEVRIEN